ncbi:pheST operon leader peptide PheM [Salmonella enterica]|nr:pheST operon leader peptide PheM [Salmonella enterica]
MNAAIFRFFFYFSTRF